MIQNHAPTVTAPVLMDGVFEHGSQIGCGAMKGTYYDPIALRERAQQWRDEASEASSEALRSICLAEANACDRRRQMSLTTPVLQFDPHPGYRARGMSRV